MAWPGRVGIDDGHGGRIADRRSVANVAGANPRQIGSLLLQFQKRLKPLLYDGLFIALLTLSVPVLVFAMVRA